MSRWTVIRSGKVINTVSAADEAAARIGTAPGDLVVESASGNIGDSWTGVAFEPAPPPAPPVPEEVTMRQARDVLIDMGLIDQVEAAIDAIPDQTARRKARNAWEHSQTVQRRFGLVQQLVPALGLSEAQLDSLFIQAAQR